MPKKLSLDDLKVQSFVTTLSAQEAGQLVGGTIATTDCVNCEPTHGTNACGCSRASNCCTTGGDTQANCTVYSGGCGCDTLDSQPACCATDPYGC